MNTQLKEMTLSERMVFADDCALEIRETWGLGDKPIKDLFSLVESKEFLLLRFPNNNNVSGAYLTKKTRNKEFKCIYINSSEPIGRQYFSLAHELYHAYYEESDDCFTLTANKSKPLVEKTADSFASKLLIPRSRLAHELKIRRIGKSTWLDETEIFNIQKVFNVSFQAIVKAIDDLKNYDDYQKYIPKNMRYLGKYYSPVNWNIVTEMTCKCDPYNKLNCAFELFEAPKGFKENLFKNISSGLVDKEDVKDIIGFFAMP